MDDIKSEMNNVTAADSVAIKNKIDDSSKRWKKGDYGSTLKWYSETESNGVIIQNSFPKGGPYPDPTGKHMGRSFLIFFNRIINETATPLELTINFPADAFATGEGKNFYLKIFLPSDTMTFAKQGLYNYGVTGLEYFLDFNQPTMLRRTINPHEEFLFYIGTVFYPAWEVAGAEHYEKSRGGNRGELVLKEQNLFYRMTPQIDSLPCGNIVFKK
jgi:hypothetical protein